MRGAGLRALAVAMALLSGPGAALAAAPFDPFAETAIAPNPGARLDLSAMVRDQDGHTGPLSSLTDGHPILLVPVQHRCPNVCGVTLAGLADALAGLQEQPGTDFSLVAFGIDPGESPADAAASLAELRERAPSLSGAGVSAVTASAEVVQAETAALGFRFAWDKRLGQFAHPAAVAVLAPDGRLVRWLPGLQPEPRALQSALAEAAASRVPSAFERAAVFLCYRYDAATGRFTPSILAGFQVLGGLSVLALGGLVLAARRRLRTGEGRT